MSSSGCCGRLEGEFLERDGTRSFPERRRSMEAAGTLYRAVRDRFGDRVRIQVVDPRNLPALVPVLVRDFRRFRVPLREAVITMAKLSVNAVVVNGRLFAREEWPEATVLLRRLEEELDPPPPGGSPGPAGR